MVKYVGFLGFDPAYKSLAWSKVYINVEILADLETYFNYLEQLCDCIQPNNQHDDSIDNSSDDNLVTDCIIKLLHFINNQLNNFIKLEKYAVVDVIGVSLKSTNEIQRACMLRQWIDNAEINVNALPDIKIIIEHQPARIGCISNDKSATVANQIAFYYCATHFVSYIDPKLKNNIKFGGIQLVAKKYSARKKHTKEMFKRLSQLFNWKITGVSKANLDDLADSFMSIIAYCLRENMFLSPTTHTNNTMISAQRYSKILKKCSEVLLHKC